MRKEFLGFPGRGQAGEHSPVAQESFMPGTDPGEASEAPETPPPFDGADLPTIPLDEGVLPSEFDEDHEFAGQTPDFLDGFF